MVKHSHACAKQLSVSGVGLEANPLPSSLLADNLHVENRRAALKRPFENLVAVNIIKNDNPGCKLVAVRTHRQLNLHRQRAALGFLDDSKQPTSLCGLTGNSTSIVNVPRWASSMTRSNRPS